MPAPWAAVAQARIVGRMEGQQMINVLNFATNTVVSDPQTRDPLLQQLADDLFSRVTSNLLGALGMTYLLEMTDARLLHPVKTDAFEHPGAPDNVGEQANPLPTFNCQDIETSAGFGGARGHGLMRLPPCGEAGQENSRMTTAQAALVKDFADDLMSLFGPTGSSAWDLIVYSRTAIKKDNADPLSDAVSKGVIRTSVLPIIGVLGRRKIGRGS